MPEDGDGASPQNVVFKPVNAREDYIESVPSLGSSSVLDAVTQPWLGLHSLVAVL